MNVRFLLDCGSNGTYIYKRHTTDLQLQPSDKKQLFVTVFLRNQVEKVEAEVVQFELLSDRDPQFCLSITADTIERLPIIQSYDPQEFRTDFPQCAHYNLAEPANGEQIGVVLGNDYLWHILKTEQKITVSDALFLVNSVFGWLIVGRVPNSKLANMGALTCLGIQESLESLWLLEALGIWEPNFSKEWEEQLALRQFYHRLQYNSVEHRYIVPWPWRTFPPPLPSNFGLAKGRMLSLVKKYVNLPNYLNVVDTIFQQQLSPSVIKRVKDAQDTERVHYLPFQLVVNETKSTPVCVVYDGLAKTRKSEPSINECLFKGTNLLNDLMGILLRFHLHAIAVTADIEKAFLQIDLHEDERDYLRFVWVDSAARQQGEIRIMIFQFRRVPFGIISSPIILAAVIVHHLHSHRTTFSEFVIENLYVDNLVISVPTLEMAQQLTSATVVSFSKGSMNLRSWASNSTALTCTLPESLREVNPFVNVLGLRWDCHADTLSLSQQQTEMKTVPTMRMVLLESAKLFDLLRWTALVTIKAKILLQQLHLRQCAWDGQLTPAECREWEMWLTICKNYLNYQYHVI